MYQQEVAHTWQIQQGSKSAGDSVLIGTCFSCFSNFKMVSSLSPVLTSPMRSSNANNSWYSNLFIKETTFKVKWLEELIDQVYLVRHIINIKAHISMPIMHFSHPMIDHRVKKHVVLRDTKTKFLRYHFITFKCYTKMLSPMLKAGPWALFSWRIVHLLVKHS